MKLIPGSFPVILVVLSAWKMSTLPSTAKEMQWCCISEAEMSKCQDLAKAISRQEWSANVTCVLGNNVTNCVKMIANENADIITLGEEQIYTAGTEDGLVPVVAEDYGNHEEGLSYYSVALIKRNLSMKVSLLTMEGRTTCHTAAGDTVGWTVPVGHLMFKSIKWKNCNPYESAGDFFEKSCVPGALSKQYSPDNENPENLCALCTNQVTCPRSPSERYYGLHGAYRCLTEGAGDVAFVDYLTVFYFTGVDNNLNPADFNLLCPNGSRKEVGDFETCNLARIPSRVVMSKPGNRVAEFKKLLLGFDKRFRNATNFFPMFNSSAYGGKNLLFKDSTVKLIDVKEKNSTEAWLGDKYHLILQTLSACPKIATQAARSLSFEIKAPGHATTLSIGLISALLGLESA